MPAGFMTPARNLPSMIGINATLDRFGSSSRLPLGQPNMIDGQMLMPQNNISDDQEFGYKSASENQDGASGDDQDQPPNKKKRYHRHTQHQIQQMEAFFRECPHPDDKQRKELSRELGLEPLQIKFWFQNKRTQMKTHHERHENTQLRHENEKLRAESMRYREALSNASCPSCGGPTAIGEMSFDEQQLRLENAQLREEIDRMAAMAAKYVGKPAANYPIHSSPLSSRPLEPRIGSFGELYGAEDLRTITAPAEADKPMIIELAVAAMEELIKMAQMAEPLWTRSFDGTNATLNKSEYIRIFPSTIGSKSMSLKSEASRETAVVMMNPISLVEIFMDVNQWSTLFSGIVLRAMTLATLSTGISGNYSGALQLMIAEFQAPTPLVPTRECYYVRYIKQHTNGAWAVVDVSLDNLLPSSVVKCLKRPSGCLIQGMLNGYSKVTWVEHVEVDDSKVHSLYKQVVSSGIAFGAKRWIATLDRQCERLASVIATNISNADFGEVVRHEGGKRSMLKLSERMVISFFNGVSGSTGQAWTLLSEAGDDNVRVMTRKSIDDPGRPPGIVLSVTTSLWLPVPAKRAFDFLRNENSRGEWDILSNGGVVQEISHIANGRDPGNCVSLLRVDSENTNQSNMLIIQESFVDSTSSYVIYAPIDFAAMNVVLNGGDADYVALLPSGFAILANNGCGISETRPGGSLLTVAFQILVDSVPTAKLSFGSVATVSNLIACTVERIKASLSPENA